MGKSHAERGDLEHDQQRICAEDAVSSVWQSLARQLCRSRIAAGRGDANAEVSRGSARRCQLLRGIGVEMESCEAGGRLVRVNGGGCAVELSSDGENVFRVESAAD